MAIIIDGTGLTIEKLVRIARHGEKVELAPEALERIKACRAMLEKKIDAHEIMYGVNTGIGEFSEVVLTDEQVKDFQRYLIYNHAAGIGDPAPIEYVRAAMAGRINVHATATRAAAPRSRRRSSRCSTRASPVRLPEGLGRRLRRPRADVADRAAADRRGGGVLQGRAPRGQAEAMDRAGIPVPGLKARDGLADDQRLEPPDRDERHHALRHEPLAQAGRDRLRHVARGAHREHEAVHAAPPRAARLPGRDPLGEVDPEGRRRRRPPDGQGEDEGPGRLLDALDAAGDRRRARRGRVRPLAGRDRAERRRRQPDLLPREEPHAHRRELPGDAGVASRWT